MQFKFLAMIAGALIGVTIAILQCQFAMINFGVDTGYWALSSKIVGVNVQQYLFLSQLSIITPLAIISGAHAE